MSVLGYTKDIFNNPAKYAKFWVAVGGFIVSLLTTYFPSAEWVAPLIQALTAGGVFIVPNKKVSL